MKSFKTRKRHISEFRVGFNFVRASCVQEMVITARLVKSLRYRGLVSGSGVASPISRTQLTSTRVGPHSVT